MEGWMDGRTNGSFRIWNGPSQGLGFCQPPSLALVMNWTVQWSENWGYRGWEEGIGTPWHISLLDGLAIFSKLLWTSVSLSVTHSKTIFQSPRRCDKLSQLGPPSRQTHYRPLGAPSTPALRVWVADHLSGHPGEIRRTLGCWDQGKTTGLSVTFHPPPGPLPLTCPWSWTHQPKWPALVPWYHNGFVPHRHLPANPH